MNSTVENTDPEPKVFAPHEFLHGQTPRQVLVERKRREFSAFNLNDELENRGAFTAMHKMRSDHIFTTALHLFDDEDFEYRPLTSWTQYILASPKGLRARAMRETKNDDEKITLSWEACHVTGSDGLGELEVAFADKSSSKLHRLYVCFDTEDPLNYCNRFITAITAKSVARNVFALQLYVDCMPVDFLRPLDPEQVSRILDKAVSSVFKNVTIDTSVMMEQYNLNHMRTINQLILSHKLQTQSKDIATVNPISKDTSLFRSILVDKPHHVIHNYTQDMYTEASEAVKFNSLWNKYETMKIMFLVQDENIAVERAHLFSIPEKLVRAEEFATFQSASTNQVSVFVKDTWLNSVTHVIITNLKEVKKGWFNVEESSVEVYTFSKLKRFMVPLSLFLVSSMFDV